MFDIGMQEIIVIIIVALIVFGPKRLPELSRTIGKGLSDLRRAIEDAKYQVDRELREEEERLKAETKTPEITDEKDKVSDSNNAYPDKTESEGTNKDKR
jgi:Tat protein translocase TatB subunit